MSGNGGSAGAKGVAVVTGAGSGIGREIALTLAREGYGVVAADLDERAACEVADLAGPGAHAVRVDAGERDSIEALADAAEAVGPITVWVNAAGVAGMADIREITPEFYERIRRVNMDGLFWGCAAAARKMTPRGKGSIVNISSNAADQPIPRLSVYAMTKAAANMLTRSLAIELGRDGIRVNCVAPGFIATPMTTGRLDPDQRETVLAQNAARSPLGLVGAPADIAGAVRYLVSDEARFITGHIMRVNGGASMP